MSNNLDVKMAASKRSDGFVYFLAPPTPVFIKIGYTRDPPKRLKDLRRDWLAYVRAEEGENPMAPNVLIGLIKGTITLEKALHRQFEHLRFDEFAQNGEYFRFDVSIVAAADDLSSRYGVGPGQEGYPLDSPPLGYYLNRANYLGPKLIDRLQFDFLSGGPRIDLLRDVPTMSSLT